MQLSSLAELESAPGRTRTSDTRFRSRRSLIAVAQVRASRQNRVRYRVQRNSSRAPETPADVTAWPGHSDPPHGPRSTGLLLGAPSLLTVRTWSDRLPSTRPVPGPTIWISSSSRISPTTARPRPAHPRESRPAATGHPGALLRLQVPTLSWAVRSDPSSVRPGSGCPRSGRRPGGPRASSPAAAPRSRRSAGRGDSGCGSGTPRAG